VERFNSGIYICGVPVCRCLTLLQEEWSNRRVHRLPDLKSALTHCMRERYVPNSRALFGRKEMSSAAVRTEAFAEDLYTLRQTKDSLAPVYSPGVYWLDRTGGLFGDRREVRSDSDTNNICSKEGRNLDSQIGKIRWVWLDWRCFVPNNTIPPFNEGRSDACKYRGPKALVQSDSSLQACFSLRFKW
jgi:hypothetical protein